MGPQNDTSDDNRLDVPAALSFADVASADDRIVLEEDQILVIDRLTYERPLEREGIHRIEVVAHDPGVVDMRRGRDQICREYSGAPVRFDDHDLVVYRMAAGTHHANARQNCVIAGHQVK